VILSLVLWDQDSRSGEKEKKEEEKEEEKVGGFASEGKRKSSDRVAPSPFLLLRLFLRSSAFCLLPSSIFSFFLPLLLCLLLLLFFFFFFFSFLNFSYKSGKRFFSFLSSPFFSPSLSLQTSFGRCPFGI
jgi:hypothetical protein